MLKLHLNFKIMCEKTEKPEKITTCEQNHGEASEAETSGQDGEISYEELSADEGAVVEFDAALEEQLPDNKTNGSDADHTNPEDERPTLRPPSKPAPPVSTEETTLLTLDQSISVTPKKLKKETTDKLKAASVLPDPKQVKAFLESEQYRAYQAATREHLEIVKRHAKENKPISQSPKAPRFQYYYEVFIAEKKQAETTEHKEDDTKKTEEIDK
jgi:hypothetical protein